MEHASAGDDTACVEVLRDLIARTAANPYIPAFLMTGQALVRLDRILEACHPPPGFAAADRRHARAGNTGTVGYDRVTSESRHASDILDTPDSAYELG